MKIAICDDMPEQLDKIVELVDEYLHINNLNAEIKTFSHPDMLIKCCKTDSFQLYILDVVMPMMNGVQLGQEIRIFDNEAQIIFTTSAPEYALDSFSVNPLNYLVKPIKKDKLFDTISLAMRKIKAEQSLTIKAKNGLYTISFSSVVMCEYVNHAVKYTLIDGKIIETTTIKGKFYEHIADLLTDKRFIQPHTSFVVNMSLVERLSRDGITMNGGLFVPISGKLFTEVKKAYIDFRLRHN